jgi:methyl coenzyme M reductase subunit C
MAFVGETATAGAGATGARCSVLLLDAGGGDPGEAMAGTVLATVAVGPVETAVPGAGDGTGRASGRPESR